MIDRLLLGCTGSVGVAFVPSLIMSLRKRFRTHVDVMMTASAQKFMTPYTLELLTGNPVSTDMFESQSRNHITYIESHSTFLIAPITASMISKIANGIADDLVSLSACVCMGSSTKLLIAPSMNHAMWDCAFVQDNVAKLEAKGALVIGPSYGTEIVNFTETMTAMASDEEIIRALLKAG